MSKALRRRFATSTIETFPSSSRSLRSNTSAEILEMKRSPGWPLMNSCWRGSVLPSCFLSQNQTLALRRASTKISTCSKWSACSSFASVSRVLRSGISPSGIVISKTTAPDNSAIAARVKAISFIVCVTGRGFAGFDQPSSSMNKRLNSKFCSAFLAASTCNFGIISPFASCTIPLPPDESGGSANTPIHRGGSHLSGA